MVPVCLCVRGSLYYLGAYPKSSHVVKINLQNIIWPTRLLNMCSGYFLSLVILVMCSHTFFPAKWFKVFFSSCILLV